MRPASTLGLVVILVALAMSFAPAAVHAQAGSGSYYVITVNADIDPGIANFVTNAMSDAQSAGANHFVLVLNTAGGDFQSMDSIVQAISNYQAQGGTVTTLVAPPGSDANDTGAYVAEASNYVYMANGTVIGSATPSSSSAEDVNGFTVYMQALTSSFNRNSTAAGLMVSNSTSYVATEALQLHVINGIVNSSSVATALTDIGVPAGTPLQTEGIGSMAISVLSNPDLSSVLFLVGVLAVMVDLFRPTIILSAAGAVAIVLALIGFGYFGAPLTSVLLMIIAAAFIFLEVKTGHGISATAGVVVFAIAFLLLFQNPVTSNISPGAAPPGNFIAPSSATYAIIILLSGAVVVGSIYLYRLRRDLSKRNKGRFDMKNFIGKEGFLTSDLKAGRQATANIDSEDWSVTGSQDLPKGARVKVKETQGFTLIVEGI